MIDKRKILAIFAHPDDESFGPGGTLARYARLGHEISLVTMTRGEAGTLGISKELSREELAKRRCRELECASGELGRINLKIHDLPDGKLSEIPDSKGVSIIEQEIRQISPEIVITFHSNGISGHSDHKTVTRWITEIVRNMNSSIRLLYFGLIKAQTILLSFRKLKFIENREINYRIDVQATLDAKINAINCHVTQKELWQQINSSVNDYYKLAGWEHFNQAWPLPNNNLVFDDLKIS